MCDEMAERLETSIDHLIPKLMAMNLVMNRLARQLESLQGYKIDEDEEKRIKEALDYRGSYFSY